MWLVAWSLKGVGQFIYRGIAIEIPKGHQDRSYGVRDAPWYCFARGHVLLWLRVLGDDCWFIAACMFLDAAEFVGEGDEVGEAVLGVEALFALIGFVAL